MDRVRDGVRDGMRGGRRDSVRDGVKVKIYSSILSYRTSNLQSYTADLYSQTSLIHTHSFCMELGIK
jgi:hypothetical protein